jgi:hypothetical protein
MNYVDQFDVGGLTVKIAVDPEPLNPREEQDNFGHMRCWHRRYSLGDNSTMSVEEGAELVAQVRKNGGIVLPLFLVVHSGIAMRAGSAEFRACDSAGWDWGQVGFIYCDKDDIRKNWGVKRVTKKLLKQAEELLEAEVGEYDSYLTGECYGFIIESPDGEDLESCWGFLGDIKYCREEAISTAQYEAKEYFAKKLEAERKYGEEHNA